GGLVLANYPAPDEMSAGNCCSLAAAGDVNGDKLGDVVVGDPDTAQRQIDTGTAYVIFGRKKAGRIDVQRLGRAGYQLQGTGSEDEYGYAVANAGDVNGDHRDDTLIGAAADTSGLGERKHPTGYVTVVYGRKTGGTVDVAKL